jgi:Fur family ferric uptake transcriptional regulator
MDRHQAAAARLLAAVTGATPARTAVLAALLAHARPATHGEVQARLARADRVTLYRALDWLVARALARRITGADGVWRYEAVAAVRAHQHPHIQCVRCGATTCLDAPLPALALPRGFRVESVELLVRGVCPRC